MSNCEGDQSFVKEGNEMMAWIKDTLKAQKEDDKVIWKASNMHHPMFALHYLDYSAIITDFLPLIQDAGYDIFFNGHEHLLNYGRPKKGASPFPVEQTENFGDNCTSHGEFFPNGDTSRKVVFNQGDDVHQFTIGASGRDTYKMCQSRLDNTAGSFDYAQNMYNGFALVKVTDKEFTVTIKAVRITAGTEDLSML